MSVALITGISGTLGSALGTLYRARSYQVVGVTRRAALGTRACTKVLSNAQRTYEDASALLAEDPDLVLLNAGQIETEVGPHGLPQAESLQTIYTVNALFPALFALAAAERTRTRPLDVVAIGSIADGCPSCFGPVYHASKIALHYFYTGVAPIVQRANPQVRLRLYRPGAIRGPLAWAPVVRLNERAIRVRARRCERAPRAEVVAQHLARFLETDRFVGTYDEPLSFRLLKLLFALSPEAHYRLQRLGWDKAGRFS